MLNSQSVNEQNKQCFSVRSPTAWGWFVLVFAFFVGGELAFEAQKDNRAVLFNVPFEDIELWIAAACLALVACIAAAWLISQYKWPGSIVIDMEQGCLSRVWRPWFRKKLFSKPFADWCAHIMYFANTYQEQGIFKRLQLSAPGYVEVLFFTDVKEGEALAKALHRISPKLQKFEAHIEQETEKSES